MDLNSHRLHRFLSPWFTEATLSRAAKMPAAALPRIFSYRQGGGAWFPEVGGWCAVLFEAAPQISQGFRLVKPHCSFCRQPMKPGNHCHHLAQLTVGLLQDNGEGGFVPAPLNFSESRWARLVALLAAEAGSPDFLAREQELAFSAPHLSGRYRLGENGTDPAAFLIPGGWWPGSPPDQDALAALNYLQEQTRSVNEKALNDRGMKSRGQTQDNHPWAALGRALHLHHPQPVWKLTDAGPAVTLVGAENDREFLSLCPDRELTWPLLRLFADLDLAREGAPVKGFARVRLLPESNDLLIEAQVETPDGEVRSLTDLEGSRYGHRYCLDGRNFFAVTDTAAPFLREEAVASSPLLALAAGKTPNQRLVPAARVPAFLAQHRQALVEGGHRLDPGVRELAVTDLPDGFRLNAFREEGGWCYLDGELLLNGQPLSLADLLLRRQRGDEYAGAGGKWLRLPDSPLAWLWRQENRVEGPAGTVRLSRRELFALHGLIPEISSPGRPELAAALRARTAPEAVDLNEGELPDYLRDYQKKGVAWLHHLYTNGIGAILADDMGLGKTHQALAFLSLVAQGQAAPLLIVCPASLLPHWADKLERFYPELSFRQYYGLNRQGEELSGVRLVLTTYGILRRDQEILAGQKYGAIVFDEIGALRNPQSETARAAALLRGGCVVGLTGTPLENSLKDLQALFSHCVPGLFGEGLNFERVFRRPIEEAGNLERSRQLARLIGPFILRRTRSQVLTELPPLTEDIRHCQLSAQQRELYRQALAERGLALRREIEAKSRGPLPYLRIIAVLQYLKQICNHPSQLARSTDYAAYESGKWDLFVEILEECRDSGLKVVVFSQYTAMLDLIERYLRDAGIEYRGLRGNQPPDQRQRQIDEFNTDPRVSVFTASLLAGGVGIDLTGAQAVIHYDRWWNSAKEEQASARVHRMGQDRPVQVFKFVSRDSIEEKIHQLIEKKGRLAEQLIGTDDASLLKRLDRNEILELLGG